MILMNTYLKLVLVSVALILTSTISAQNIQITGLSFSSPSATNCTNTMLNVNTTILCINAMHTGNTVSVSGSTVTVNISYTIGPICLGALSFPVQNINLGMLPAGTNTIVVNGVWNSATVSTMTTSLTVTSCCPAIPSFTVSNDTICTGDSLFFANNSTGVTSHEWFENNVSVGTATNYGKRFTTAGSYDIKLVVTDGFCSDSSIQTILVSDYPTVNLGKDTSFCQGELLVLNPGSGYDSLRWSTASTNATISASMAGLYHVRVYENGCESRDSITLTTFLPTPVDIGMDTAICSGQSLLLNATTPGVTYRWQDNTNLPTLTVDSAGSYWVIIEDMNQCESGDTVSVALHDLPSVNLGNDTVICIGEVLVLDVARPASTYLWQDASVNSSYIVTSAGTYTVTVIDSNGCAAADAIQVMYDSCDVGIQEVGKNSNLRIYPNPTSEKIYLQLNNDALANYWIELYDLTGQLVQRKRLVLGKGNSGELEITTQKPGTYVLKVIGTEALYLQPFIKQ